MLTDSEWSHQESKDPEQGIGHNRDLYTVWGEKTNFLKIAADNNVFNSSYFLWLDIGAVREKKYNNMRLVRRVPADSGVLLLSVERFTEEEKKLENGKSFADFSRAVRLGGGTIGCDQRSLEAWHKAYYRTMTSYLHRDLFAGKDQNMMATTCLETDLCLLVNSDLGNWFKLQDWLIGKLPGESYQRLAVRTR